MTRQGGSKVGKRSLLKKAWGSLGQGKALSVEASELSQQSAASQVTNPAAESPRQKANLMKRVARSLSFRASPRSKSARDTGLDQKQGSEMESNRGVEVCGRPPAYFIVDLLVLISYNMTITLPINKQLQRSTWLHFLKLLACDHVTQYGDVSANAHHFLLCLKLLL